MSDMASGMASPVFAGRAAEFRLLEGAFDAAAGGMAGAVLIGGEGGGGKSRLVSEFTSRLRERALVLAGGCVEVSTAGLPYAPFTALLRELVRSRGAAEVAALLPGRETAELAVLLPEFGAPPSGGDPEMSRARLFETLLALFEAVAEQRPLVLVIEDAHWADRATCDLLSFLVRNLRQASVLFIVTFRSDDLDGALLRPLLAGLGRMEGVWRVELDRLSRDQVAAQLAGILGRPPGPALTNAVYRRGGGNPLFTEALVSPDGTVVTELPWSLRDLILAAVKTLPAETEQVLRVAAVGGDRVGHALLVSATGLDDAALTAALRPAVASHVLVGDADGYAFRHQLFREAVLGDLLPGERAAAHRAFAEAIEAVPAASRDGAAAAALALHWRGAREDERALIAAWQAAAGTGAVSGYAQRLQLLEQLLELWGKVPEAALHTGTDHVSVLELAADTARWAGEPERGMALADQALAELGPTGDPERRAAALTRRAGLRRELLLPGQLDDLHAALRLAAGPTPARARIIAQYCWALRREDRNDEAQPYATELAALARQLGDEERQAEAAMLLAAIAARNGEDTVAELRTARDAAASLGSGHLEVWAYLTLGHVLEGRGSHELAIQLGREGLARARQLGLGRQLAAPIAANLAESLTSVGRWDEALEILDEILSLGQPPLGQVHTLLGRGQIVIARGDLEAAAGVLREVRALPANAHAEGHYAFPLARLEIDGRLAEGDFTGALVAARAFPAHDPRARPDPRYSLALLATAMRACADTRTVSLPPDAPDPARLRKDLQARADGIACLSPLHDAYAVTFAAEAARADGRHDVARWDAACAAWDKLGQPYPAAYALLHAARAAATGNRDEAAPRLRRAAGLAGQLGARPLTQQVVRYARQLRVDLPASTQAVPPTRYGLTEREFEVLRLLADGRGNRDIAAELFISPKTASVHVSNILAKLGAATRTEAAVTAHRQGLLEGR
jgi:predicted ATPase/DNA-binding CsgD family transcriptional regulator